jgi:hypothetical protein
MQGRPQPDHLGIDVQKHGRINSTEKSVIRKVFRQLLRFMNWLAKGQEGNLPCVG